MAYRSLVEVLAGFVTRLDTPPSSDRHHPVSRIAPRLHGATIAAGVLLGPQVNQAPFRQRPAQPLDAELVKLEMIGDALPVGMVRLASLY